MLPSHANDNSRERPQFSGLNIATLRQLQWLVNENPTLLRRLAQVEHFLLARQTSPVVITETEVAQDFLKPYNEIIFEIGMQETQLERQLAPWVLGTENQQVAGQLKGLRDTRTSFIRQCADGLESADFPRAASKLREAIPSNLPRTPSRG